MTLELYQNVSELSSLSTMLARSGTQPFKDPAQACAIILRGRDFNLSPMTALCSFYMVGSTPSLYATAMVALVRNSGKCASWRTVESTDERVTVETRRADEEQPERCTWTTEDAKRAGTKNMGKFPRNMLYARAASELARRVYPEVLLGVYSREELDNSDLDNWTADPALAPQRVSLETVPAVDTSALRAALTDAQTLEQLQDAAAQVKAAGLAQDSDEYQALGAFFQARKAQLEQGPLAEVPAPASAADNYLNDAAAWEAHLRSKERTYDVAGALVKRMADFAACDVLSERLEATCERLLALGVVDPRAFVEAESLKADAREAGK